MSKLELKIIRWDRKFFDKWDSKFTQKNNQGKKRIRWDIVIILLILVATPVVKSGEPPADQNTTEREFTAPAGTLPAPDGVKPELFDGNKTDWENKWRNDDAQIDADDVQAIVNGSSVGARQIYYTGGAVGYPYRKFTLYDIFTAPFHATQIILENGERVIGDIIIGDGNNYKISLSSVISEEGRRPHIFIKPAFEGRKTNLIINTTKRTYNINLISFETTYMPIVYWEYSDSQQLAGGTGDEEIVINAKLSELDYNYKILSLSAHAPAWQPSIVFTDGISTFLQFPSAARAIQAPTLFEIKDKKRILINYRVVEDYYIIEGVKNHMELILDSNLENIIVIKRR